MNVLDDVLIIGAGEVLRLMRLVGIRPDEAFLPRGAGAARTQRNSGA
jgi:hypothetical protein